VNSYADEQNSQVTTTLPSFTMSARSPGAKLARMAATASREQEHLRAQLQRREDADAALVKQAIQ
jgi:hypothetical protein